MDELAGTVNRLARHARAHQLAERACGGCALFLRNAEREGGLPGGMKAGEVEAGFRSHALYFGDSDSGYPHISTRLDLVAGGEEVGHYELISDLGGQVVDDYLVFEGGGE
jgi:hypothetical protein